MFKVKNNNYIAPEMVANENRLAKYAAEISAYIAGMDSAREYYTYEEIKTDIVAMNLPGLTAADITPEKISAVAIAKGLDVIF